MTSVSDRSSRYLGPELGRRCTGFLLEVGVKAYGAAAALSVALSDAETVGGKARDAVAAVPNLMERYRDARYVVDHREEIRAAVDYVNHHAPDAQQVETAAQESAETLTRIETTYTEVIQATEAFEESKIFGAKEAFYHLVDAWSAVPDLDSLEKLGEVAEGVAPVVRQAEVLVPKVYGGLLTVVDNFASDEIAATLGIMSIALVLAFTLGTLIGFWARRGRPGLVARTLQSVGARVFRGWYVGNLDRALSRPLYAAARERITSDIVADPQNTLDPEALQRLERYFERRRSEDPSDSFVGPRRGT